MPANSQSTSNNATVQIASPVTYPEKHTTYNKLLSFALLKNDNGNWLLDDYTAEASEDTIKLFIPYLAHFSLKPQFSIGKKAKVYVNGAELFSGKSTIDFSNPVQIAVVAKGKARTYTVLVQNSGLPVMYLNTKNVQPINSKKQWLDSTRMVIYKANGEVDYNAGTQMVQVKGRGNSTWSVKAKRPYALKLKRKAKLLGMPEGKQWCLLANFFDPSFFRNELANYLGQNYTNLDWTPHGQHVELVLNGVHVGNYYLCEKVKAQKGRVPGDYLVEADRKAGRGDITGIRTGNVFNIKDSAVKKQKKDSPEAVSRLKFIIDRFENTLYVDDFLDPQSGYKTLIDLESFVDWFLIKELSKDFDGNMFTSCFFHIMPDSTIKMGPIWDFDLAFGGNPFGNEGGLGGFGSFFGGQEGNDMAYYNDPEGYHIAKADWFVQMFKDPEFISLLLKKATAMLDDIDKIDAYIDSYAQKLSLSASADTVNYYTNSGFGDAMDMDFSMEDFEDMGMGGFPMFGDSAFADFGAFPFSMPGMDSAGGFGAFPFPMPGMDSAGGFGAFPFPMPGMDSAGGFGAFPFPMPGMDSTAFGDFSFGGMGESVPHRSYSEEMEWIKTFLRERLVWMKGDLEKRK